MLAGTGATFLGACTPEDRVADSDLNQPKGGIGGTGIVGTLTDFGSLIVNGLRVEIPADLAVETALGTVSQGQLALGHTLTIEANRPGSNLTAQRVRLVHPVIGQVQSPTPDGKQLVVGGIPIMVEAGAPLDIPDHGMVAVSGAWRQTMIVASRIEPAQPDPVMGVSGTLRPTRTGEWTIGSLPIMLPIGTKAVPGAFATASGMLKNGTLFAQSVQIGRFTGAAGPLVSLSVEGYFAPTATAPFHTIDGLGHQLSAKSDLSGLIGRRVLLSGSYDGLFVVENGDVLPEAFDQRRAKFRERMKR